MPEPMGASTGGEADDSVTPFDERFVMIPRDVIPERGRRRNLQSRDLYLLITLYRLAFNGNRVLVTPERLSAFSGIPESSLRRMIGLNLDDEQPSFDFRLAPWIERSRRRVDAVWGQPRTRRWEIFLRPVDKNNFLRVPWWWLWTEDDGRRATANSPWEPGSPGIFAALAIAHVGRNFTITGTYGHSGLATVAGVSPRTMASALRDAEERGWISVDGDKGGEGRQGGAGPGGVALRRVNYERPSESSAATPTTAA